VVLECAQLHQSPAALKAREALEATALDREECQTPEPREWAEVTHPRAGDAEPAQASEARQWAEVLDLVVAEVQLFQTGEGRQRREIGHLIGLALQRHEARLAREGADVVHQVVAEVQTPQVDHVLQWRDVPDPVEAEVQLGEEGHACEGREVRYPPVLAEVQQIEVCEPGERGEVGDAVAAEPQLPKLREARQRPQVGDGIPLEVQPCDVGQPLQARDVDDPLAREVPLPRGGLQVGLADGAIGEIELLPQGAFQRGIHDLRRRGGCRCLGPLRDSHAVEALGTGRSVAKEGGRRDRQHSHTEHDGSGSHCTYLHIEAPRVAPGGACPAGLRSIRCYERVAAVPWPRTMPAMTAKVWREHRSGAPLHR